MKRLAIIPARGGSKRIPRKNIKSFLGKPIIAYPIETAISSGLFDEIMVSTDDTEIADIAKSFGASVPFLRSEQTANDHAVLADVIKEVLSQYQKQNLRFEYVCCILPTAVFISEKILSESYNKLIQGSFDSVFPVVRFSYPIFRALKFEGEKIEMVWKENLNKRSQDFPETFHDSGLFYWINTQKFLESGKIFSENSSAIILKESEMHDIDTLEDWETAELKYRMLKERK